MIPLKPPLSLNQPTSFISLRLYKTDHSKPRARKLKPPVSVSWRFKAQCRVSRPAVLERGEIQAAARTLGLDCLEKPCC
jgi:hypothetical protein